MSEFDFESFRNVPFVKRALDDPRVIVNRDGTTSSVRTEFRTEKDQFGNWQIFVYPTVQDVDGRLKELPSEEAFRRSLERRDFLAIPTTEEGIPQAEQQALEFTKGFSTYLGSDTVKQRKARAFSKTLLEHLGMGK